MQRLALRMPNWVGDALMVLPIIDGLTALNIEVELLGKSWLADLFSGYNVTTFNIPPQLFKAQQEYKRILAKDVVLFTNSIRSAAAASLANKNTVGYLTVGRSIFLTHGLKKAQGLHETEYFFNLAAYAVNNIFAKSLTKKPEFKLKIGQNSVKNAEDILLSNNINANYLVLCPGATGHGVNGESKVWPYWDGLIKALIKQKIALIACPANNEIEKFTQIFPREVKILPGVNLSTYAAIMQSSKLVIANDSGPLHLAAAVNAQVLGLFGVSSPKRVAPKNAYILGELGKWPLLSQVLQALKEYL
ncbi:MAG: hypothetical protein A3F18_07545 [Legionellales bacterium RIFCSPHIGHO2_12_FULL_37_14]|nr:MAG: hypothetical protein A3F18_07545 [Legionellales bacterium RIFCSPHIGHO2_12_FULL_37_14]